MIELIVTLVLVGIMGVVVLSRFLQPNSFGAVAARNAVIATARGAQQIALGREGVSFRIGQSGSNWLIAAYADDGLLELRSVSVPMANAVLETGPTTASADTCANGFDTAIAGDFEVQFDGQGNASAFINSSSNLSVDNGVRICINDDDVMSVCISPGGFAHEGACEA